MRRLPTELRVLDYATPTPRQRRGLDLRGTFVWVHALNLAIGLAWLLVIARCGLFGFLIGAPMAGASALFQFFFFTLPGWVRILEHAEMPAGAKPLALLAVTPGTLLSLLACVGRFADWDWCC